MTVFDDKDVISNKKVRDAVYTLLNQILEVGRHMKISCICTSHYTRRILNESHYCVWFPNSGGTKQMKYLLTEYLGLDREMIRRTQRLKSRAVVMYKHFPQFLMSERDIFLLHQDEDQYFVLCVDLISHTKDRQ